MTTTIKVTKWGNSLGVRLPASIAKRHGLEDGSSLTIDDEGDRLTLRAKPKPRLRDLIARMPKKPAPAIEFGPPVGKEIW